MALCFVVASVSPVSEISLEVLVQYQLLVFFDGAFH